MRTKLIKLLGVGMLGVGLIVFATALMVQAAQQKIDKNQLIAGTAAFIDYRVMKPGTFIVSPPCRGRPKRTRSTPIHKNGPAEAEPALEL